MVPRNLTTTERLRRGDRADELLEAVLLWFGGGGWTPERMRRWDELIGTPDATSKALCDAIRAYDPSKGVPRR